MLQILKDELTNDPLGRGYSGMTDEEAANSLNTPNRTKNDFLFSPIELYECLDLSEYRALNATNRGRVDMILALNGTLDGSPGTNVRSEILALFDAQSNTRAKLIAKFSKPTTRANELGYKGQVKPGHVEEARR